MKGNSPSVACEIVKGETGEHNTMQRYQVPVDFVFDENPVVGATPDVRHEQKDKDAENDACIESGSCLKLGISIFASDPDPRREGDCAGLRLILGDASEFQIVCLLVQFVT